MKKTIVIIGPFPPPISGVSIANDVLAAGLKKTGWKVDNINSEYSEKISGKHGKFSLRKLSFLKTYLLLYKVFFSKIVYITIGQSFFGVIKYAPFILFSKLTNKTLVVHLHGGHLLNEYNQLKGVKKWTFFKLLSMFDYGIVLSKSLRKNLEPFIEKENIHELNNFFEETLVIPSQELNQSKNYSELRVIFLSNLIEEKGINILLQAVQLLKNKGIVIQLKIAGILTEKNDLSGYFNTLENVEYIGVVQGDKKKALLLWGNVFCLPTFYKMEGQPISILEAMALGNLILTTKHAGIPDICNDGNTIFCEKRNVQDLTDKLEFLTKNISQMQPKGMDNFEYANKMFSEQQFIKNASKILSECTN